MLDVRLEEHSKNVLDQNPDESDDTATPNAKAKNEEAQEETAEAKEGSTNLRLQHSIHSRYQETNHYESSHIKDNAQVSASCSIFHFEPGNIDDGGDEELPRG